MSDRQKVYKMKAGGMQHRFHQSRAGIQFVGGGYGNGKTAAACIKALRLCEDYPGCNGLIARSTYPKLNDTIRREFLRWCPRPWIKRMPTKDDNTLILINGTTVNFRYVAQRGKETEEARSNLLSATYDWIVVDQLEDPEFSHKDFMDLIGRLRGTTPYRGEDYSMPVYGPGWLIATCNPTRNWVYRKIVKPLHDYHRGVYHPDLLCEVDDDAKPVLVDGKPKPIIEMFEGSTYENRENVGDGYIRKMLSTYTGVMRDRFVYGKWGALSGLVYPNFSDADHVIDHDDMLRYLRELYLSGYRPTWVEGYDHGLMRPSCYGLFFADDDNNVFLLDGWYAPEQTVGVSAQRIREVRDRYRPHQLDGVYADPDLFRRKAGGSSSVVGQTVASLYEDNGIEMRRGNRDVLAGVSKNWQYLAIDGLHEHPLTSTVGAPHFYVSNRCTWFIDEVSEYYFSRDTSDEITDKPADRNDHAMDMWKYAMTSRPKLADFVDPNQPPAWMTWQEVERATQQMKPRHR